MAVKEISGFTAGIDFRRMIENLTIWDTNLEMWIKKTILAEGTAEIEVRVRILVEAIGGKGGRLNALKVSDVQSDQTQSTNVVPIKLSAICMSSVELPYVPILLNETFTKALWDTGVEKSFISEETYRKYFVISK
ncbi:uncharacterized protein TNCV_3545151 [Trichonephila clavipes]|uniref:Uncharacterized protein n=1 Tax=Trichonephila clavipes TaxID=2585209 RepID=A0A8X6RF59_TRICX|nr:uncharacterized protein TNCV_3545151 [Trichonephila clavipes]